MKFPLLICSAVLLWVSCATVQVQEVRETPARTDPYEAVGIHTRSESDITGSTLDDRAASNASRLRGRPVGRVCMIFCYYFGTGMRQKGMKQGEKKPHEIPENQAPFTP